MLRSTGAGKRGAGGGWVVIRMIYSRSRRSRETRQPATNLHSELDSSLSVELCDVCGICNRDSIEELLLDSERKSEYFIRERSFSRKKILRLLLRIGFKCYSWIVSCMWQSRLKWRTFIWLWTETWVPHLKGVFQVVKFSNLCSELDSSFPSVELCNVSASCRDLAREISVSFPFALWDFPASRISGFSVLRNDLPFIEDSIWESLIGGIRWIRRLIAMTIEKRSGETILFRSRWLSLCFSVNLGRRSRFDRMKMLQWCWSF